MTELQSGVRLPSYVAVLKLDQTFVQLEFGWWSDDTWRRLVDRVRHPVARM